MTCWAKEKAALLAADEKPISQPHDITPAAVAQAVAALKAADEAVRRVCHPLAIRIGMLDGEPYAVLTRPEDLRYLPGRAEVWFHVRLDCWEARKVVNGVAFRAWCKNREEAESCA